LEQFTTGQEQNPDSCSSRDGSPEFGSGSGLLRAGGVV
jgi:hypothetical protein